MSNVSLAAASADELNGSGGRLVTTDGRTLPLRGAVLRADARGGVARVVLEQRFENVHDEPLHVTYLMPLPADGAVSGYAFTIGARRVVGEVDRKRRARERFEQAILNGQTAGLVVQERSSLFTQELGNVPPRTTIVAELTIDQRLAWLDEGAWEWRFPTVAGPRYQGAAGRVADGERTEIAVANAPLPVTMSLALTVRDALPDGRRPESPMHALASSSLAGRWEIGLGAEHGVRLDRDVVVRWPVAAPRVGLSVDIGRPRNGALSYGLVSIVPPAHGSDAARARRRDLILLLDTSGSMGGEPLEQSRRTCLALLDTLGEGDSLEMIEFSSAARRWKSRAVPAVEANLKDARKWLAKLEAGGGTEMVAGVLEALAPLSGEAQRQVVLLTDGYIGFETEVVRAICDKLPQGSRLHVVGVGSAVNRSLTAATARAGRGVEVIVAPGEDPERPVARLLARTSAPIVTEVAISGDALIVAAPARLPDLFAGSPSLAAVSLKPEGGTLVVRGRTATGNWEERVTIPARAAGEGGAAAAALFARESVEDCELALAAGGDAHGLDAQIEALGLQFQIATRLTTWIAISEDATLDPTAPTRREEVPQELPHGLSLDGIGLRGAAAPPPQMAMHAQRSMMAPSAPASMGPPMGAKKARASNALGGVGGVVRGWFGGGGDGGAQKDDDEIAESAPPSRPAPKPSADAPAPADQKKGARRRRAVLRARRGRQWVLELLVDGEALEWSTPPRATLLYDDGTEIGAQLDLGKTTRAGSYAAGTVVRLVLELDDEPGARTPRTLTVGGIELEVSVA